MYSSTRTQPHEHLLTVPAHCFPRTPVIAQPCLGAQVQRRLSPRATGRACPVANAADAPTSPPLACQLQAWVLPFPCLCHACLHLVHFEELWGLVVSSTRKGISGRESIISCKLGGLDSSTNCATSRSRGALTRGRITTRGEPLCNATLSELTEHNKTTRQTKLGMYTHTLKSNTHTLNVLSRPNSKHTPNPHSHTPSNHIFAALN